ncbi:YrhB domain-containing protein [Streptomyces sp. NPDC003860]
MLSEAEGRLVAENFLRASEKVEEPDLDIDWTGVQVKRGVLIAPYNSSRYLKTRDVDYELLDCWPILVDLSSGKARFGSLEERAFWKQT